MLQRSELPVRGDQRTGNAGGTVFIKGSPGLMTGIRQGKVAIIGTHRLGLARIAGRILVMERGRIVQDGAHAELMAAEGIYARMFRAQAAWYVREER